MAKNTRKRKARAAAAAAAGAAGAAGGDGGAAGGGAAKRASDGGAGRGSEGGEGKGGTGVPPQGAKARMPPWGNVDPPLLPSTVAVVHSLGFKGMTPVQAATLPLFLKNKDVCVEAVTGSGKTLAFVVPIVERLLRREPALRPTHVGAIVVSPTRELAAQTYRVLQPFLSDTVPLQSILLVGGTDVDLDVDTCASSGCNIIVATPGRLLDVMNRLRDDPTAAAVAFKTLEVLVLDEADTLLDMGFHATLSDIMSRLPKQRRTGLFSATQTREVKALAKAGMRNPVVVSVQVHRKRDLAAAAEADASAGTGAGASAGAGAGSGAAASALEAAGVPQKTPTMLRNGYCVVPYAAKPTELVAFLAAHPDKKFIVFFLTCACVDFFHKALLAGCKPWLPATKEFPLVSLHGKMPQKRRLKAFASFTAAKAGALLCTDVAARGLDLPDVDWIIQYDPPQNPSFFVHRVGRTARAGRRGSALLYLDPAEQSYVQLLTLHQVPIDRATPKWEAFVRGHAGEDEASAGTSAGASAGAGTAGAPDDATSALLRLARRSPVLTAMKAAAKTDRDVLEKGTQAFVSFVRGYKEHHCQYVFRMDQLDYAGVAYSMALLKLPKVTELRGCKIEFEGEPDVDTSAIAFKDKHREAQRLANQAATQKKREAEHVVRQAKAKAHAKAVAKPKPRVRKGKNRRIMEEWERLSFEETLAKRVKKGKMSWDEFDKALRRAKCDSDASDDDASDDDDA